MSALQPGTKAPDFTLPQSPESTVSLSSFLGRPVVLIFYPADWSPVCGDEIALFTELSGEFAKFNAAMLGISVDGVWSHLAFARDRKATFPLLSDSHPKGRVAEAYGVYRPADGISERALFVVDKAGVIAYSYVSPILENPGADGVLKALESLG